MAEKASSKGTTRKAAQSMTLSQDTIAALEREASRRGIPKSQLADQVLNSQLETDEGKPTIIAVMSYKGGVAKTTTSTSLAVCFAENGKRVLVIDLDGQGNASQYFQVYDPRSEDLCIADVLYIPSGGSRRLTLEEVMRPTDFENLYVVPSNFRFADADAKMKADSAGGVDTRLRYAIEDMNEIFDYIIIDCGPRLDMTTTNAIVALEAGNSKSHIIIPIKVDGFAIAGVSQTVDIINRTAVERRTHPQPWKILRTMVEPRTVSYKLGIGQLKDAIPSAVYFNVQISKSTVVTESNLAMEPLIRYEPTSKPALEYGLLAAEIEAMNG